MYRSSWGSDCIFMWVEKGEMQRALRLSPFHGFLDCYFTLRVMLKLREEEKERPAGWQETGLIHKNSSKELARILPAEEDSPAFLACTVRFLLRNQVLSSSLVHSPEMGAWEGLSTAWGKAGLSPSTFQPTLNAKKTQRSHWTKFSQQRTLNLYTSAVVFKRDIEGPHMYIDTYIFSKSEQTKPRSQPFFTYRCL